MKMTEAIGCNGFPCLDIEKHSYCIPNIDLDPSRVRAMMISECSPSLSSDYFYSPDSLFSRTTLQAFRDSGMEVRDINQLIDYGFYFTTAVKCGKKTYGINSATIRHCSFLLEGEFNLFENLKVVMLMGDVAIKTFNEMAKRKTGTRAIPAGSTYRLRESTFFFNGLRIFPSYLQAGPSFFIEKSKRKMISEDIASCLAILK
ncbi:MAG: hypothetical protein LUP94_02780 [Candidatus Methanomethylicus sp.]|nr:hypothetical protein [Candidatus Methanomethylicus sp.]